ncbi:MAG: hypothetical protein D6711_12725, partial [Chloroflexi bacterium]
RLELQQVTGFPDSEFDLALNTALDQEMLIALMPDQYMAASTYHRLVSHIEATLREYHAAYPLRIGMPKEEIRRRVDLKNKIFAAILERETLFLVEDDTVRLKDHEIHFTNEQQTRINQLTELMDSFTPPSRLQACEIVGEDVLYALIERGDIVQIQPDLILSRRVYEHMLAGVLEIIDKQGAVDVKTLRDYFNTSRKYAIGLLEYLDRLGVTRRVGDVRIRGAKV